MFNYSIAQDHNRRTFSLKTAMLVLAASTPLGLAGPAHALDATDFFRALKAEAEANGNTMTFDSLEAVGTDGARASGIRIVNTEKGDVITISAMTLSGTEVLGNDGFAFETMEAVDLKLVPKTEDGRNASLTLGRVSAEDFRVLPAENRKNPFWPMDISEGRIEEITLVSGGKNSASLNIPYFEISGLEHDADGVSFTLDEALLAAGSGSFASEDGTSGEFSTGEIEVSDAARLGRSGFSIDVFSFDGINASGTNETGEDIAFSFSGLSGSDIFTPDYSAAGDVVFPGEETRVDIGALRFALFGKDLVSMAGGISVAQFDSDTSSYDFSAALNDLYIDVRAMPTTPQNARNLQQFFDLGYDDITLDVSINGGWNTSSGLLDLQSYRFDAENMAALDMSVKLDGYTVEFARKLQEISARMNAATDPQLQQAMSMQMLAEMSALSVRELQLKLEDNSLTRRIMQQQAERSGQSADDMAAALPFMAGAMLAQLNVPEFAASVSAAIGAYFTSALNDRGTLILKADPERPVSFAEIMGIAAGVRAGNVTPAEVIEQLNLTVSGE